MLLNPVCWRLPSPRGYCAAPDRTEQINTSPLLCKPKRLSIVPVKALAPDMAFSFLRGDIPFLKPCLTNSQGLLFMSSVVVSLIQRPRAKMNLVL